MVMHVTTWPTVAKGFSAYTCHEDEQELFCLIRVIWEEVTLCTFEID